MVSLAGGALRGVGTLLYMLDFLCAAGIVGITSYFIAALVKSNMHVDNQWRAVEGLSGAATLFTIFAVLLTCFLGGMKTFAFIGILMDLLFMGAMIAIAVILRAGTKSCSGTPNTVFGAGAAGTDAPVKWHPTYKTACDLEKAIFALAVAGAALFLLTALVQFAISAHHQKEKKYGPGPSNGYTSGSGKQRFWKKQNQTTEERFPKDAEAGMVVAPVVAYETVPRTNIVRPSHDTGYTEATAVGANNEFGNGTLNAMERKEDRAILPPVVDESAVSRAGVRGVSRAESRQGPVEVASVPVSTTTAAVTGPTDAAPYVSYYTAPAENVSYPVVEPASGFFPNSDYRSDPASLDVTKAIFGHEDSNTGRNF